MLLGSAILVLAGCSQNKNQFTVVGDIANMPAQKVYLEDRTSLDTPVLVDSATSDAKGHFELSGQAPEQGLYKLRFEQDQELILVLEKGQVHVTGDWNRLIDYQVSGSPASSSLRSLFGAHRDFVRDYNSYMMVIDTLYRRGNDTALQMASEELGNRQREFTQYIENYADTTRFLPNAMFAASVLDKRTEQDFLLAFSSSLERRFPGSQTARDFAAMLTQSVNREQQAEQQMQNGLPAGTMAPEISLPTPEGRQLALSSFKGKYVLVDFWASWCRPCRIENPNVVAAFQKFKAKNFTILGVSLDKEKEKWQEAIREDQLQWSHISDLAGWESVPVRTYNISGIPANFLVDPSGKIIATNLRGPELEAKLAEVLR